jgi:hypothetical protein
MIKHILPDSQEQVSLRRKQLHYVSSVVSQLKGACFVAATPTQGGRRGTYTERRGTSRGSPKEMGCIARWGASQRDGRWVALRRIVIATEERVESARFVVGVEKLSWVNAGWPMHVVLAYLALTWYS